MVLIPAWPNGKGNKNSKEFEEYSEITKAKFTNNIYNTYDTYLKKKYKIDINYQALDSIKNNFKWI